MAVMPLIAAGVSALFCWSLARRYAASKRPQSLAWAISLGMFAVASLVLAAADTWGWGPWLYRWFWVFGAVLNVPWLAAGSISLAWPRFARVALILTGVLSLFAFFATLTADPLTDVLQRVEGIPIGKDTWPEGSNMLPLARISSIGGWLLVVGIAAWTSRTRGGMAPPAARVRANTLIAVGVSIVAVGGFVLGRIGGTVAFSASLAIGVLVMYAGFLFAGRAPRYSVVDPGDQAT